MGLFNNETERLVRLETKVEETNRKADKTNDTLQHVIVRLDKMDLNGHTTMLKQMAEEWPQVKEVILDKQAGHLAWRTISFGLGIALAVVSIIYFSQQIHFHV